VIRNLPILILLLVTSLAVAKCGDHTDSVPHSIGSRDVFPPPQTKILWNVPPVQQETNYTCGASAMQSVFSYYGQSFTEAYLAKELGSTPKDGTDHHKMADYAKKLGIKAEVKHNLRIADLAPYLEREQAIIIEAQAHGDRVGMDYTNIWDSGHYMVVIGLDEKNIYFMDPSASGNRGFLPIGEFMTRWHDLGHKNEKLYYTAIFFDAKPSPVPLPTVWTKVP